MKSATILAILCIIFCLSSPAQAQTTSATPPPRDSTPIITPPDPNILLQGGDTWDEAFLIPEFPFFTTGTTIGYTTNCCVEMCPYEAWGPAVFYTYTAPEDIIVQVDLCGSNYDTGLYIFDENHYVVACNIDFYFDDECGVYVSKIEDAYLEAEQTYFIVVTGMGGSTGDYIFDMTEYQPPVECVLDVSNGIMEGEPPLFDGYQDSFNGGCNSPEFDNPFQELVGDPTGHLSFAGVSGWFMVSYNSNRDTDWFTAEFGPSGIIDVALLPEVESYLFELAPQDCQNVAVAQSQFVESCTEGTMQVSGEPGSIVWLWVGPSIFTQPSYHPDNEYDYLLTLDGLQQGPVAIEKRAWDSIRAIYR